MTVARTNPLAPGVYWIDVWRPSPVMPNTPDGEPAMQTWLAQPTVKTLTREVHADQTLDSGSPAPFRIFYVFQVTGSPVADFPFTALGFPTVQKLGGPEVITSADTAVTSDDTVQKPPPEPLFDWAPLTEAVKGVAIVGGGLWLLDSLAKAWLARPRR